jgi:hypothetical protein
MQSIENHRYHRSVIDITNWLTFLKWQWSFSILRRLFLNADRYLLWPVTKVNIDLSRRNASTQGRKTDLVERYQHYAIAFR